MEKALDLRDIFNETIAATSPEVADKETEQFSDKILNMAEDTNVLRDNAVDMTDESANDEGEVFPFKIVTDQRIVIDEIKDTYGKLSERVAETMQRLQMDVVPFSAIDIMPQVTELKEHYITEIDGMKYASNTKVDTDKVSKYRDAIYDSISSGMPYRKSLYVEKDGIKTLILSELEWSFLCSIFNNYNPRLVITKDHDFVLCVG